jgi:hypothetical protein
VKGTGEANCLHALYDWGATVTLVTHAAAARAGLERKRQVSAAIAGLGGRCTMVDSYYMVPVVDGNDAVRVVKALGLDHIVTLAAANITEDIMMRISRTEGFTEKLTRPAGEVEMLIGMDNQGWMPMHVESSRLENNNLRLMQSVLSPRCIQLQPAGTTSRYSMGETPPIKAERPELGFHLGSTCLRGSISTRILTRALQPDQEEVSSWGFRRAQIVSGRQTFPPIFWLDAGILARRGDFNARQGPIVRPYFYQAPIFCIPA